MMTTISALLLRLAERSKKERRKARLKNCARLGHTSLVRSCVDRQRKKPPRHLSCRATHYSFGLVYYSSMLPRKIPQYVIRTSVFQRIFPAAIHPRLLSGKHIRRPSKNPPKAASAAIDVSFYEDFLRAQKREKEAAPSKLSNPNKAQERGKRPKKSKIAHDVWPEKSPRQTRSKKSQHKTAAKVEDRTIEPLEKLGFSLFASCLPGLEAILHDELINLGFNPQSSAERLIGSGGIAFTVDSVESLMKCHLHLGTATHVLLRCGEPFKARGMEELRRKVSKMDFWRQYVGDCTSSPMPLPTFDIRVSASKSRLLHTKGIAQRVESGIYTALGVNENDTPQDSARDSERPAIRLVVRVKNDYAQISVDTSEQPLHRRGYRQPGCAGKSPLREDIAYALLYGSGWRRLGENVKQAMSFSHLLDPCCGSGTIPIEGAALASGLPPGRLLPQPMAGSSLANEWLWRQMMANAESQTMDIGNSFVLGSDRDKGVIAACKENAAAAGVQDIVQFENCAVKNNPWLGAGKHGAVPDSLLICTNPPFGIRSSKAKNLYPLYKAIVDCAGESGSSLTILAHDVGLVRTATRNEAEVLFSSQHGGLSIAAMRYRS